MLAKGVLRLGRSPKIIATPTFRTIKFWWGHDTLQDQAQRKLAHENAQLMAWTAPNVDAKVREEFMYAPARIRKEETEALALGYDYERLNIVDMYSITCYPWLAFVNLPHYHQWRKGIQRYQKLVHRQCFSRERVLTLGPDLAAAHFLLARNCRVRFAGSDKWLGWDRGRLPADLPVTYEPGFHLEAVDASDTVLVYEAYTSLRNLHHLKYLDLSYSMYTDAWCLDRITGEYGDSLEYLDLSGCTEVKRNGLECLWRLRNLKVLVLRDMSHVEDLELVCLMLLDVLPNLEIRGVDYLDTAMLVGTEDEHLLDDSDLFLITDGKSDPAENVAVQSN